MCHITAFCAILVPLSVLANDTRQQSREHRRRFLAQPLLRSFISQS